MRPPYGCRAAPSKGLNVFSQHFFQHAASAGMAKALSKTVGLVGDSYLIANRLLKMDHQDGPDCEALQRFAQQLVRPSNADMERNGGVARCDARLEHALAGSAVLPLGLERLVPFKLGIHTNAILHKVAEIMSASSTSVKQLEVQRVQAALGPCDLSDDELDAQIDQSVCATEHKFLEAHWVLRMWEKRYSEVVLAHYYNIAYDMASLEAQLLAHNGCVRWKASILPETQVDALAKEAAVAMHPSQAVRLVCAETGEGRRRHWPPSGVLFSESAASAVRTNCRSLHPSLDPSHALPGSNGTHPTETYPLGNR